MARKHYYKRIQNFAVLFSIMVFAALSYGCDSNGGSATNNYRTGTRGIEINYAASSPPSEVYYSAGSSAEIPVALEIWNRGAESGSGTIFFDGYDPNIFSAFPPSVALPLIEGKEASRNPQGTNSFIDVKTISVNLPEGIDVWEIPLRATACYKYSTMATINVCVDPNPSKSGTRACTPVTNPSVSGGQGGPVAVSAIEYNAGLKKAIFTITIKNVGGGGLVSESKTSTCLSLTQSDIDVVGVSGTLSNSAMSCMVKDGKVRLVNGEAIVVCTATLPDQSAYTTPLTIKLTYGYKYSTQKNIQIKRI